ncbi:hypothetical protein [Aeoliella mucimassa]|uniref:Uncharacterized protein n=1 Tax=Aeoliella mucimassa TaxID=2527972 RepID=A0A518AH44_9BACT|nr:hypothetical protein [Aeoliella mucimassa]QDU54032.1 hypothetical protein Pan181_02120 [Aeoliella mucimassa]
MPDKFDPYRERLVVESDTCWGADLPSVDAEQQQRVSLQLHEDPSQASQLDYVRTHTGFCRRITVTPADLERLGVQG